MSVPQVQKEVSPTDSPFGLSLRAGATGLRRTCEAMQLYQPGHPTIRRAAVEAADGFGSALPGRERIRIAVAPDRLLCEDLDFAGDGDAASLAATLFELGVAGLEIRSGTRPEDMEALATAIVRARQDRKPVTEVQTALEGLTAGRVRLVPLDYSALRIRELGSGDRAAGSPADVTALIKAVMRSEQPLAAAAAQMTNEVMASRDRGSASVGPDPRVVADAILCAPDTARAGMVDRLRAFMSGLTPELRRAFLRPSPGSTDSSVFLLAELADLLPADAIADSLAVFEQSRLAPSREAIRMLGKFIRCAERDAALAQRLEGMLDHWQSDARNEGFGSSNLRSAVTEILSSPRGGGFSPAEYQNKLDELTSSLETPAQPLSAGRPEGWSRTREHAAAVAVDVARRRTSNDDSAGVFAFLTRAAPGLATDGKWALLAQSAQAAEEHMACGAGAKTVGAARALLASLAGPSMIDGLTTPVGGGAASPAQAAALLRAAGPAAIVAAVHALSRSPSPTLRTALTRAIGDARTSIKEVIGQARGADELTLLTLLQLAMDLPTDRCRALAEAILADERPVVRRAAFQTIGAMPGSWPSHVMDAAIRGGDAMLRDLALAGFRERPDTAGAARIAAFASGRFGRTPDPGEFRASVGALSEVGDVGLAALWDLYRLMSGFPGPRGAARCALVGRLIESRAGGPVRAIPTWRRIVVGAACRVFGGFRAYQEG